MARSQSVLYRSINGVRPRAWYLRNEGAVWTSVGKASWLQQPLPMGAPNRLRAMAFAGQQFFAFSTFGFAVSQNGTRWSSWVEILASPRRWPLGPAATWSWARAPCKFPLTGSVGRRTQPTARTLTTVWRLPTAGCTQPSGRRPVRRRALSFERTRFRRRGELEIGT